MAEQPRNRTLHAALGSARPALLLSPALLWIAGLAQAAPAAFFQEEQARIGGQEGAKQQEEEAGAALTEERDIKRVLHLQNGQRLRGRTRTVDGQWQVRRGPEWVPIPVGSVVRAVEEKSLLAQARKLERELDEDPVRRVAYADWLHASGLSKESIDQLDLLLSKNPDQSEALALIERADFNVALPMLTGEGEALSESVEALMRAGALARPTGRELAILRLGEIRDEFPLHELLATAMHETSPKRRAFCALALRRIFPGEEVRGLLARAILDGSDDVRRQAALSLAAVNDPAVSIPALKALGSSHPKVRTQAAEALGNMGYATSVPALMSRLSAPMQSGGAAASASPRSHIFVGKQVAYIQDFDVEVAQFEAVADPQINVLVTGSVLDTRVLSVQAETVVVERSALRKSLRQLTGADPGNTVKAWEKWWAENESDWTAKNLPREQ